MHWHGDVFTYPLDIRDMKVDIGICPVIDDTFNRGKSELKWLEYSALKVPTVCSPVCYTSLNHGKTGYYAKDNDEWFKYLDILIESKEKRKEIADSAYTRVVEHHNIDKSIAWYYALKDLLYGDMNKKQILTTSNITNKELMKARG